MKRQFQLCFQKFRHFEQYILQMRLVFMQNHKIIGIANIIFDLQSALYKMVKLIHVYIHE